MSNQNLIQSLVKEPLFAEIKKDSFLALRKDRIDFYYKGGKLFSYDNKGFSTHIKYASVIDAIKGDYVTEKSLKTADLIKNFSQGIKRIKENCKNYADKEAKGVADIYSKHSYLKNKEIVVLDIEIAFEAKDRKGQDRIDILLLDQENKNLIFVEAKHFSNGNLWSESTPEVINQIKRYEQQISIEKNNILEKYRKNIKLLNELFEIELQLPEKIDDKVVLFIFGFGDDEKKGKLQKDVYDKKEYEGKRIYAKGNVSNIVLGELIKSKHPNN